MPVDVTTVILELSTYSTRPDSAELSLLDPRVEWTEAERFPYYGGLLDHPADITVPRSINCYLVEVQEFGAAAPGGAGKKFKIDPQRAFCIRCNGATTAAGQLALATRARSAALLQHARHWSA
jgi:hypothetical protein